MSQGLTYEQSAANLGCHFRNVAKLIRKGQMTARGYVRDDSLNRPSRSPGPTSRPGVRGAGRAPSAQLPARRLPSRHRTRVAIPRQVAELLGVTRPEVRGRIHQGALQATENGGRLWIRRDLLEQLEAARLVRKTRRLCPNRHLAKASSIKQTATEGSPAGTHFRPSGSPSRELPAATRRSQRRSSHQRAPSWPQSTPPSGGHARP